MMAKGIIYKIPYQNILITDFKHIMTIISLKEMWIFETLLPSCFTELYCSTFDVEKSKHAFQWPLLLKWFNFNPSSDK